MVVFLLFSLIVYFVKYSEVYRKLCKIINIKMLSNRKYGSVAKNLAFLQNQEKPSQLGKLINITKGKMIHKGENYSIKLQKYYFCNGTRSQIYKANL